MPGEAAAGLDQSLLDNQEWLIQDQWLIQDEWFSKDNKSSYRLTSSVCNIAMTLGCLMTGVGSA